MTLPPDFYTFPDGRERIGREIAQRLSFNRNKSTAESTKTDKSVIEVLFIGEIFKEDLFYSWVDRLPDSIQKVRVTTIFNKYSFYSHGKVVHPSERVIEINQEIIEGYLDDDNFFKQLPFSHFDLIVCCFELHFCLNWRWALFKLLERLKEGGSFLFVDITEDFEFFDGNFKNKNSDVRFLDKGSDLLPLDAFKRFMMKFDELRSEYFYWKPAISTSNYQVLAEQIDPFFQEVQRLGDEDITEEKSRRFRNTATYELSIEQVLDWLKTKADNKVPLSYLRMGLSYDNRIKIAYDLEDWMKQNPDMRGKEKVTFKIEKGLRVYLASGLITEKLMGFNGWSYKSFPKDIQSINDSNIGSLARKALDLMISHGFFIPDRTLYAAVLSWQDDHEGWDYPIHLILNEKLNYEEDPERNFIGRTVQSSQLADRRMRSRFARLILLEKKQKYSGLKSLFKTLPYKFQVVIRLSKHPELEYKADKFALIEDEGLVPQNAIRYRLNFDSKNQIKRLTILLHSDFNAVRENKVDLKGYEEKLNQPGPFEDLISVPIKPGLLRRYVITDQFADFVKSFDGGESENVESELIGKPILYQDNDDRQRLMQALRLDENGFEQLLRALDVIKKFQLREPGFQLSLFPSGVIQQKSDLVKGLGGILIYEKTDPLALGTESDEEQAYLELIFSRNRAIVEANNLIFYKVGIVNAHQHNFKKLALQAAIANVFARNGSHGLGSHVLPAVAALATSSLKDDQILFSYIQQRLDFIAQATAGFPRWTYPSWLIKDVLSRYFKQKHLLSNLAASENLGAFEYDNGEQYSKIQFVIRKRQMIPLGADEDIPKEEDWNHFAAKKMLDDKLENTVYATLEDKFYGIVVRMTLAESGEVNYGAVDILFHNSAITCLLTKPAEKIYQPGDRLLIQGTLHRDLSDPDHPKYWFNDGRIIAESKITELIDEKGGGVLSEDVQVAIPGGIVGYQAFYSILENAIRNAAKHNWTKLLHPPSNLILTIEIDERQNQHYHICRIWTNSTNMLAKDGLWSPRPDFGFTQEQILDPEKGPNILSQNLNKFIAENLIDRDGRMSRNNLGMAEMKIAAGFLYKYGLLAIGSLDEKNPALLHRTKPEYGIFRASDIWERDGNELIPRLGFRFKLLKPREIVFITNDSLLASSMQIPSVTFADLPREIESGNLDYEFCLLHLRLEDQQSSTHPLLSDTSRNFLGTLFAYLIEVFGGTTDDRDPVGTDHPGEIKVSNLQKLMEFIEDYPYRLILVYPKERLADYIAPLIEKIYLGQSTRENKENTILRFREFEAWIQGMSMKTDLVSAEMRKKLRFIQKRIYWWDDESFRQACAQKGTDGLTSTEMFKLRVYRTWVKLFEGKGWKYQLSVINEDKSDTSDMNIFQMFKNERTALVELVIACLEQQRALSNNSTSLSGKQKMQIREKLSGNLPGGENKIRSFLGAWLDMIKEDYPFEKKNSVVSILYDYLEDRIKHLSRSVSTVPICLRPGNKPFDEKFFGKDIKWDEDMLESGRQYSSDRIKTICYKRHSSEDKGSHVYFEHLTGSKISYALFQHLPESTYLKRKFQMQLVENALMTVLILDERILHFVNDEEFRNATYFNQVNIAIVRYITKGNQTVFPQKSAVEFKNDSQKKLVDIYIQVKKREDHKRNRPEGRNTKSRKPRLRTDHLHTEPVDLDHFHLFFELPENTLMPGSDNDKFRISTIILHHTLLESLCEKDKTQMDNFINALKLQIPSVMITSGRGRPQNLPELARYLPFSHLESHLLQKYPDKLLFSQAIFKALHWKWYHETHES